MLCQSSNYLRWYAKQSQMSSQIFGGVTMNNQTKCIDSHGGRCVSQRRRGLGFSDLHSFNLAMLAKQCRGMIQNHDSLCACVLHDKYYPDGNILEVGTKNDYHIHGKVLLREFRHFKTVTFGECERDPK